MPGQQGCGAAVGRQIPVRAIQPERGGPTLLPDGTAIKGEALMQDSQPDPRCPANAHPALALSGMHQLSCVVVQRLGQVKWKGNLSVLPFGGQLGRTLGTMVVGRLVGCVRARAYFRTVLREMPSCRAISRSEMPWTLASCTAFHSASWRGDSGVPPEIGLHLWRRRRGCHRRRWDRARG